MRNINIQIGIRVVLAALLFAGFFSCREEGFPVPEASTQAGFTWQIDTLFEGNAIRGFGIQFANTSILATSFQWDFGDGHTSNEKDPYVEYVSSGQYLVKLTVTPEKSLYYNRLERTANITLATGALPIPYLEDFTATEDIPEMMTAIDLDGDGFGWYWGSLNGVGHLRSQSWDPDAGALTPDNWIITPQLELGTISGNEKIILNLRVGVMANTPAYRREHYGVYISDKGKDPADFELLYEETFTSDTPRLTPLPRQADISAWQGKSVFIAVRHYKVSDNDRMFLDQIEVKKQNK